jgi:hypothetical protein
MKGEFRFEGRRERAPDLFVRTRLTGAELAMRDFGVAASGRVEFALEPSRGDPTLAVGTMHADLPATRLVLDGQATETLNLDVRSRDLAFRKASEKLSGSLQVGVAQAEPLLALAIGPKVLRDLTGAVLGLGELRANAHFVHAPASLRVELGRLESGALSARGFLSRARGRKATGAFLFRTDVANVGLAIESGETNVSPLVGDDWLPSDWQKLSATTSHSETPKTERIAR